MKRNLVDCSSNIIFWVSCTVFLNKLPIYLFDIFFICISMYTGIIQSFFQIWNILTFPAKLCNVWEVFIYIKYS